MYSAERERGEMDGEKAREGARGERCKDEEIGRKQERKLEGTEKNEVKYKVQGDKSS